MVRIRIIYCANNPLTRIDPSGKFIWFAPLILYAPVILASLAMLVNTPVLQANLADNINTASSRNASSVDKMIAIGSIGADLTSAGGGSRIAKNAIKGRAGEAAARSYFKAENYIKKGVYTSGKLRIPDIGFEYKGVKYLGEVKNTLRQGLTRQIKDTIKIANGKGVQPALIIRKGADISSKLLRAAEEGTIKIFEIPMPH